MKKAFWIATFVAACILAGYWVSTVSAQEAAPAPQAAPAQPAATPLDTALARLDQTLAAVDKAFAQMDVKPQQGMLICQAVEALNQAVTEVKVAAKPKPVEAPKAEEKPTQPVEPKPAEAPKP